MPTTDDARWSFWIDRGGTFTDVVARRPDGSYLTTKLLSECPARYQDAAIYAIRSLMQIPDDVALPADQLEIRIGTTLATNALLERRGAPVLLITTSGFGDQFRIGYQTRPQLFALQIEQPKPLYLEVVEVQERITAEGQVIVPLDASEVRRHLEQAYLKGLSSCAIVLMHGYRYPQHEQHLAQIAHEVGFSYIAVSHQTCPLMKLVSRGDTTLVDAYLSPTLLQYIEQFSTHFNSTQLRTQFMHSGGGVVSAEQFRGHNAVLSGPAGGLIGAVQIARSAGYRRIVSFDMGGTSTDVAHYSGQLEYASETTLAGLRLRVPSLAIETVAAGGGSMCWFDGSRLRVGPHSAGAVPGPASYRLGGPLTVTDCHLLLGTLQPDYLPACFGTYGDQKLDRQLVLERFQMMSEVVKQATGSQMTVWQLAQGWLQIALEHMASAIKQLARRYGIDLSTYLLVGFGGASGQHICHLAEVLGIEQVLLPWQAGVLSAWGIGQAQTKIVKERSLETALNQLTVTQLHQAFQVLTDAGRSELIAQKIDPAHIEIHHRARLKYLGTDTALLVPCHLDDPLTALEDKFTNAHRQRFGFVRTDRPVVIESLLVEVQNQPDNRVESPPPPPVQTATPVLAELHQGQTPLMIPLYWREQLAVGTTIVGPAIVQETTTTSFIALDWQALTTEQGHLLLTRLPKQQQPLPASDTQNLSPILLEVLIHRLTAIAGQMGQVLANSAYSVNIKERLDFSCAIFDAKGQLIATAAHIPVHLGSMSASIQALLTEQPTLRPGQVYLSNHPYRGGTHLPDLTVITPLFDTSSPPQLLFLLGSRGHHADIGGLTPGSMPAHSHTLLEEGIVFDNFLLVKDGLFREQALLESLTDTPYPARQPSQNVADLQAQIAANQHGAQELLQLVGEYGWSLISAYLGHILDHSAQQVSQLLGRLTAGHFELPMDHGSVIRVSVTIERNQAVIDFTGTTGQVPTNFNAPPAITRACVWYVLRTLLADQLPLTEGCWRPIRLIIPAGSLLNPNFPAAVVAGNVETSQTIVNALYGALGVLAASQGTMNNITFGDDQVQYYETLAGGAGAGQGFDGASAVHTHMTNSRLTDPEVLEWRLPVLVESCRIRADSGGVGRWRGGDGLIRKLRFRKPLTLTIISNNRVVAPFGLAGGREARPGENRLQTADGHQQKLTSCVSRLVNPNEVLIVETPGGGGYGQ